MAITLKLDDFCEDCTEIKPCLWKVKEPGRNGGEKTVGVEIRCKKSYMCRKQYEYLKKKLKGEKIEPTERI